MGDRWFARWERKLSKLRVHRRSRQRGGATSARSATEVLSIPFVVVCLTLAMCVA
ncbi:hypothetical protein HBB16_12325, partial [Pseudonocardia sp. MCCB 268]|nr:hypothetical protein [Pseudonocardia cytotoxica]